eukprot:6180543-Pleurochrysis_carterae.AAC.3
MVCGRSRKRSRWEIGPNRRESRQKQRVEADSNSGGSEGRMAGSGGLGSVRAARVEHTRATALSFTPISNLPCCFPRLATPYRALLAQTEQRTLASPCEYGRENFVRTAIPAFDTLRTGFSFGHAPESLCHPTQRGLRHTPTAWFESPRQPHPNTRLSKDAPSYLSLQLTSSGPCNCLRTHNIPVRASATTR